MGTIFNIANELDEVKVKYEIEKNYRSRKVVILSALPLDKLSFVREYCETGGYLDLSLLHRYIKQKVHDHLGMDLLNSAEEIVAIGKLSIGKGGEFWSRIKVNGKDGVFSLEDILDFLSDPEGVFKKYGTEEKNLFCDYMSAYTPHALRGKPVKTVAKEITAALFNAIIENQKKDAFLIQLYQLWLNSKKHEAAFKKCLAEFNLPLTIDIWQLPVNHPFKPADDRALEQIIAHIKDKTWIANKLDYIEARSKQVVLDSIQVEYWRPVFTLFSYAIHQIDQIYTLKDAVAHYVKQFYKLDNDMRRFYQLFLAEERILKPLQNYYLQILELFLAKWFQFFETEYQENQSGLLGKIIEENQPLVAIIVGDAISFGIAHEIRHVIQSEFQIEDSFIYAGFPSETLNNMSKLFSAGGKLLEKAQREKKLVDEVNKKIEFMPLDDLSVMHKPNDDTIFYSDDVDSISEKKNQKALKYYNEFIAHLSDRVKTIFACGYKHVFLVSDHGFILTGNLDEADKIEIPKAESVKLAERYCLCQRRFEHVPEYLIEYKQPYLEYDYIYFAKSSHPFKTTGAYGFAHGGLTPQELIVPFFKIEKLKSDYNTLQVSIVNKDNLKTVVGDVFKVKIKGVRSSDDIFGQNRKIQIVFLKDKKEFYQSDIISLEAEKQIEREFSFKQNDCFVLAILDAQSKMVLDSCQVTKIIARDLSGLGV